VKDPSPRQGEKERAKTRREGGVSKPRGEGNLIQITMEKGGEW